MRHAYPEYPLFGMDKPFIWRKERSHNGMDDERQCDRTFDFGCRAKNRAWLKGDVLKPTQATPQPSGNSFLRLITSGLCGGAAPQHVPTVLGELE